jgi:hypothetical protein|tara:strand:- start:734 stop:1168 length:435 start_codon:yes stop_codon:yes gene_type:complete
MRIFNPSNLVSQPRIFILCFFIGSFIWFFNELNSTSDTTVKYPLVFEYENKSDYVVLEPLPRQFEVSEFIENKIEINHSHIEGDFNIDTVFTISYLIQSGMKLNLEDSFEINLISNDDILLPSFLHIPEGIEIVSIFPEKIIIK